MTSQGNGQPALYEVKSSKHINDTIKQLHQQAAQQGRGHRFLASLRIVYDRLQRDPHSFGEPLYRLPALKLVVFQVVVAPLVVDYVVHQEQPFVFLRGVKLLG